MKKLFTLLAFLGIAASAYAQVTFSFEGGQNDSSWSSGTDARNVTSDDANAVWRANPYDVSENDPLKGSYVILKAVNASSQVVSTHIQGYTIKLGPKVQSETGMPTEWKLEGSNDKNEWDLIHKQKEANRVKEFFGTGSSITPNISQVFTYYCNTSTAYKYFRLTVISKTGGSWGCFEMAKFDLIPSNVGFSPSEQNNGMDGDTNTSLTSTQTITVNGTESARITGFQFTTGNDNSANAKHNPRTIKVEGSNTEEADKTWTTIEMKTNYTGLEEKQYYPFVLQCYGTQDYKYYRFSFDDVASGSTFKMSEIAVITESTASCGTSHDYNSEGFCKKCLSPKTPTQNNSEVYQISNAGEFVKFAQIVNSGTAANADGKLTADIDLTDVSWTPIGTDTYKYYGKFDGGDKRVMLAISTTEDNQGLFGYAKDGAEIKDLIVEGTINCGGNSAALIGQAGGNGAGGTIKISRVGCEAKVTGGSANDRIGAFVGNDWGYSTKLNIENSYNIGDITGSTDSGHGWTSVVGCHLKGGSTFTNVYNKGSISSHNFYNDVQNGTTITCTNCYTTESGNSGASGLTQVTPTQITNGELCYKLGSAFYQTLNTDNYPVLSNSSGQVILNGTLNNSYVNTASTLSLDDANFFGTNSNFNVTSVSMTRTLKCGKWNTFCIPFDMTEEEITSKFGVDAKVKTLTGVTNKGENYTMTFSDASTIEAGKPYMVKVPSDVASFSLSSSKTIKGELTPATFNGLTFTGTYTNGYAPLNCFIISNNNFYLVDTDANNDGVSEVTLKAFRGYITVDAGGESTVKALNFDFEDDATGIEIIDNGQQTTENDIYNLAGQRLNKVQKGINIVNGKKVLF